MKKELIDQLYNNRLLRNKEEFNKFEEGLQAVSSVIQEEDIGELCNIFDDNTRNEEVMFGLIHLIEMFSSERAFELTIISVGKMIKTSPNWARIIIYRCLNDDFSRKMLKKVIGFVDEQTKQVISSLLNSIKEKDGDKFEKLVDEVLS